MILKQTINIPKHIKHHMRYQRRNSISATTTNSNVEMLIFFVIHCFEWVIVECTFNTPFWLWRKGIVQPHCHNSTLMFFQNHDLLSSFHIFVEHLLIYHYLIFWVPQQKPSRICPFAFRLLQKLSSTNTINKLHHGWLISTSPPLSFEQPLQSSCSKTLCLQECDYKHDEAVKAG